MKTLANKSGREGFVLVFEALKELLAKHENRLVVKASTPVEYTLLTRKASPFPQHKGQPMWFGSVRLGRAYVSFHLLPLYMNDALKKKVSPALAKKMQGKACFNFKAAPEKEIAAELGTLTAACFENWRAKDWA